MIDDDEHDGLPEELELPEGVVGADDAVEVLRAWVVDGALHVTFDPETFHHDVTEWGRLLSDVAQHVATAVELDGQMTRTDAIAQIHEAFELNMQSTNAVTPGRIKGRTEH